MLFPWEGPILYGLLSAVSVSPIAEPQTLAEVCAQMILTPPAAARAAVKKSFCANVTHGVEGARVNADGSVTRTATRVALAISQSLEIGKNVSIDRSPQTRRDQGDSALVSTMDSGLFSSILTARGLEIGGNLYLAAKGFSLAGKIVANSLPGSGGHQPFSGQHRRGSQQRIDSSGTKAAHHGRAVAMLPSDRQTITSAQKRPIAHGPIADRPTA